MNQYEIVLVNLDPTIGSEIRKTRPCLIISPNEMNHNLNTIIIAPVTSKFKDYPTRIETRIKEKKSFIILDQIRTIDKKRIIKSVSKLNPKKIQSVKTLINEMLVQ
mgnify:CR=1 FL=1